MSFKNLATLALMLILGSILAGIPPTREQGNLAAYELAKSPAESSEAVDSSSSSTFTTSLVLASVTRSMSPGSDLASR